MTLSGSVSDDKGVKSAHYRVNNGSWVGLTLTGTAKTFSAQAAVPEGSVTIDVESFDIYGKSTTRTITGTRQLVVIPTAPALSLPLNNAVNQPLPLSLNWRPVSGASAYRLQVAADSLFAGVVLNDSSFASTDTSRLITWLDKGKTYFWRVCARNSAGEGSYSIAWRFALVPNPPRIVLRVLLEGAYQPALNLLGNALRTSGVLASRYTGRAIPVLGVDSLCIEVRDSAFAAKATTRREASAWLMTDGTVRSLGDTTKGYVEFDGLAPGNYYFVVKHRNHLAIMSRVAIALTDANTFYDFTTGQDKAWGTNPMKQLAVGVFGLYAGDANGSSDVSILDRSLWRTQNSLSGYLGADFNLTGDVSILDRAIWRSNNSVASQVP